MVLLKAGKSGIGHRPKSVCNSGCAPRKGALNIVFGFKIVCLSPSFKYLKIVWVGCGDGADVDGHLLTGVGPGDLDERAAHDKVLVVAGAPVPAPASQMD